MRTPISNKGLRNEALRQVENGISWSELARRGGYARPGIKGKGDTSAFKRALGLRSEPARNGHPTYFRQTITPDTAKRLCDALGVDPVDVGV